MYLRLVLLIQFYFGTALSNSNLDSNLKLSTRIPNDIINELEDTINLISSYQKSSKDAMKKLIMALHEQTVISTGNEYNSVYFIYLI